MGRLLVLPPHLPAGSFLLHEAIPVPDLITLKFLPQNGLPASNDVVSPTPTMSITPVDVILIARVGVLYAFSPSSTPVAPSPLTAPVTTSASLPTTSVSTAPLSLFAASVPSSSPLLYFRSPAQLGSLSRPIAPHLLVICGVTSPPQPLSPVVRLAICLCAQSPFANHPCTDTSHPYFRA